MCVHELDDSSSWLPVLNMNVVARAAFATMHNRDGICLKHDAAAVRDGICLKHIEPQMAPGRS